MASPPPCDIDSTSPAPSITEPFRFKRKRSPTSSSQNHPSSHPRHHHHHRHHHRSRRRPHTPRTPSPIRQDPIDADTAFRESLFDALADDEGAAYWEGVYGQPVHTYSPYLPTTSVNEDGETTLERMTDEEYVKYVRGKMWEKSHEYIYEERKRREEGRQRQKQREEEQRVWEEGVEEALRRGEERRKRGRWRGVWEGYLGAWEEEVQAEDKGGGQGSRRAREVIRWPVESGKWEDVEKEGIELFYRHAPQAAKGGAVELVDVLKKERVKWHPDKMQQRAGPGGLDKEAMGLVTAVFQVVDRLWGDSKGKS